MGLKNFITGSDGLIVENPRFLKKTLKKLRKANKRLARRKALNKKTGEIPSNRWVKAHKQLVKTHQKLTNQREDFIQKTTTMLVQDYAHIGLETLNIKGMSKNKHLSKHILDAGWGKTKTYLTYKSTWYNTKLTFVDTFYPSSKICSRCGTKKTNLSLSERTYKCDNCGLTIDRDLNAAINIENMVAQSCGETLNARGGTSAGSTGNSKSETSSNETRSETLLVSQP